MTVTLTEYPEAERVGEVTVTLLPTSTSAPTLTSTPTFALTETETPAPTPKIETVPFNEQTYKNLPQLDVAAWEKAAGRPLTPKDIIDASKLGDVTPFPSDALVTGFKARTTRYKGIEMDPIVKGEITGADELPITVEAVILTHAEDKIPKSIHNKAKTEGWTADKLLILVQKLNTPSGELIWVIRTDAELLTGEDGATNKSSDFLDGTGDFDDGKTIVPAMQMSPEKSRGDWLGSMVARAMWEEDKVTQEEIMKAMAGADLTNPEDLAMLQELFDKNFLYLGATGDEFIEVQK